MTYLSIDMDYWLTRESPVPLSGLFKMLRDIKAKDWLVVDEHHHLLAHINACQPSSILHVDFHTDIA